MQFVCRWPLGCLAEMVRSAEVDAIYVQIASWVTAFATALRYHFFSSFRLRPLGATALRLLEQVQGNLDAVRAV